MRIAKKRAVSGQKQKTPTFTATFQKALKAVPLVQQMANENQHLSLDGLCQRFPQIVHLYCDHAITQLNEQLTCQYGGGIYGH